MPKRSPRPRSSTTGDLATIAAFAALIIVLGAVSIPAGSTGIPIVLQNMGVMMAGMILGWRRGGLAVLLFLGVGFLGVPNMAGWTPALTAISGPTVGYIVGYALIGFLIGALCDLTPRQPQWLQLLCFLCAGALGVAINYLCGALGLMVRTDLDFTAAVVSNGPFLPGDIVKTILAALISTAVLRAIPDLRPARRAARISHPHPTPVDDEPDHTPAPAA